MNINCPWCGAAIAQRAQAVPPNESGTTRKPAASAGPSCASSQQEAGTSACSRCGVSLDAKNGKMNSGWAKLPGRKDMAKLQFGNSTCQIEGTYVPAADLKLAPEDWVTFAHHVLLWKDPEVVVSGVAQDGPWKMLAGPTRLLMEARGPGHIAFSENHPGELITLPLEPGQKIHVRQQAQSLKQSKSADPQKHLFLAATGNVTYTWFDPNVWFHTGDGALDADHHYPVGRNMDVFGAKDRPGLLLLHAAGNVFVRQLAAGQHILVKPAALVFKDSTVKMDLYYEIPNGVIVARGSGYICLRLHGPGRVAIQSVFERVEGEEEFSKRYNRHSTMYPLDAPIAPAAPIAPLDPTKIPTGKTPLKIGIVLAVIAFLVFLFRRATLPPNAVFDDYGPFIPLILLLGMLSLLSLFLALFVWKTNAPLRKQKTKLKS